MRINTLLHERHLLQAVQRGVITQEQAEALLALARSEAGGAARMPDTAWLAIVQACVAAAVVGAVAVGNTEHTWRVTGTEEVVRGLGAMGLFLGLGLALRRVRAAEAPASVLLAGAVMQLLGVGHGWARMGALYGDTGRGIGLGFALVSVAGFALWRWLRVGPALGVSALGALGVCVEGAREVFGLHGDLRLGMVVGLAALVLLALSVAMDRAAKRPAVDGAFWLSLTAGVSLLFAGAVVIDRAPGMFFSALGLALGVGHLALRARRRVLLAGVGVALFALPPFAASEARLGDAAVAVAMLLGAVAVGVGAHYARRALVAQAAEGAGAEDERSVWG